MRAGGGLRIRGDQQRRPDGASRRQAVAGGEEEHHGRERIVDVRRALQDPAALAQDVDEVPPLVPPGVGGRQCAGAVAVTVELVDGRVHPGHAQHAGVEGAVEHLGVAARAETTRVTRVAVGALLLELGAGEGDLVGVDDDDEVTGVDVRRKRGLVLATQQRCSLGREATQNDVGGVDDVPGAVSLSRLLVGGERTHGRSLRSVVDDGRPLRARSPPGRQPACDQLRRSNSHPVYGRCTPGRNRAVMTYPLAPQCLSRIATPVDRRPPGRSHNNCAKWAPPSSRHRLR